MSGEREKKKEKKRKNRNSFTFAAMSHMKRVRAIPAKVGDTLKTHFPFGRTLTVQLLDLLQHQIPQKKLKEDDDQATPATPPPPKVYCVCKTVRNLFSLLLLEHAVTSAALLH